MSNSDLFITFCCGMLEIAAGILLVGLVVLVFA